MQYLRPQACSHLWCGGDPPLVVVVGLLILILLVIVLRRCVGCGTRCKHTVRYCCAWPVEWHMPVCKQFGLHVCLNEAMQLFSAASVATVTTRLTTSTAAAAPRSL